MDADNTKNDHTIYLGLCMAGAVSAGAYTAGVMDYLLEALEEWEKRRAPAHPEHANTPAHRVVIPVIGGASAGGMTSIITAAAMNNLFPPVQKLGGDLLQEQPYNKFYHSWVDLTGPNVFEAMLDTSDISTDGIYALLNSSFIDEIAERAIRVDPGHWVSRPYFNRQLKLFVTLSNLEGFSYQLNFRTNASEPGKYIIKRHSDFACFALSNHEQAAIYDQKGWTPLCFRSNLNVSLAKSVAMATGAFPIGLRSRKISRLREHIIQNDWLRLGRQGFVPQEDPYNTLNIDGGLINNEPFERVQELLKELLEAEDKVNKLKEDKSGLFRSTILLIDPFPSSEGSFNHKDQLLNVLGHTFSAMMGQLRIKPEHVVEALNEDNPRQFLIAPKRKVPQQEVGTYKDEHGEKAIASGSLSGFGGFLHKEFRIHDFFLGRANCERFLRHYFTIPREQLLGQPLPADREVSQKLDYSILRRGYAAVKDPERFQGHNGLQIIPLFTKERETFYMPVFQSGTNWPLRQPRDIERFKPAIGKRIGKLVMNIGKLSTKDRFLLWGGKVLFLQPKLSRLAMSAITQSLQQHCLLPLTDRR